MVSKGIGRKLNMEWSERCDTIWVRVNDVINPENGKRNLRPDT